MLKRKRSEAGYLEQWHQCMGSAILPAASTTGALDTCRSDQAGWHKRHAVANLSSAEHTSPYMLVPHAAEERAAMPQLHALRGRAPAAPMQPRALAKVVVRDSRA